MTAASPRSWLRDPLLHFVLLGAAAAGLYALSQPAEAAESNRIVLTEADLAFLEHRPRTADACRRSSIARVAFENSADVFRCQQAGLREVLGLARDGASAPGLAF